MTESAEVSPKHPRAESIRIRERLTRHVDSGVVSLAGLIAHGRGEAFDYMIGEKTTPPAEKAIEAAAASLLLAKRPILSVNGNVAALCADELVKLASVSGGRLEVNLFHRTPERERMVEKVLTAAGATEVLGIGEAASATIEEVYSDRRRVDPRGILIADVVFVPLEDGDRTEALVRMGKKVITVDLNPLSRTSQWSSISIVDNVVRAVPLLVKEVERLREAEFGVLKRIEASYDNQKTLSEAIRIMEERLHGLAEKGVYIELSGRK